MKEDKLEKYIRDNRSQFDDAEPSEKFWNKVSADINKRERRKIPWLRIAWQAAAAILIFFTAWYMKDAMQESQPRQVAGMQKNVLWFPVLKVEKQNDLPGNTNTNNNLYAVTYNTTNTTSKVGDTLPSDFLEASQYYAEQITRTRSLIMNCASYDTEIDHQVNVEFAQLDTVYMSLRKDLKDNIDNSEVLEAMILNYRMRLEILQSIMQQLETTADCSDEIKRY
jgi:hypothetical protein